MLLPNIYFSDHRTKPRAAANGRYSLDEEDLVLLGAQFVEQMRLPPLFHPLGLELAGAGTGTSAAADPPAGQKGRRKPKATGDSEERDGDGEGDRTLTAAQLRARRKRELAQVEENSAPLGAIQDTAQLKKGDSTAQEVFVYFFIFFYVVRYFNLARGVCALSCCVRLRPAVRES